MAKRKYWTDREMDYLKTAYPLGIPMEKIAANLQRFTVTECYRKANYMYLQRNDGIPVNKTKWSKKDIAFIRKHFHSVTNPALAKSLGKTLTVVRNKCRELGLLHMELEYWTPEQVEYLKANYKTKGDQELAREFQKRWPKKKVWSKKHLDKKRGYLGLKRTLEEQFLIRTGRFNAADYKGFNGKNFQQGKKRLWFQNGKYRWMIKVGNTFLHLHRHKWELKHGAIPKNKKLHFIDGDTTNCKLSNLVLLTRSQLARLISNKNHAELSDSYIAGILSWRDPEMKKHIINHPGILDAKRQQIILNRKIGLHRCKKGSSLISQPSKQKTI